MEYILFLSQEGNFQTRTMLIPRSLFLSVRQDDYNTLKQHATKQVFTIDNKEYTIDNVLFVHYVQCGKTSLKQVDSPFLKIINELTGYADENTTIHDPETDAVVYGYYNEHDEVWYPKAITRLGGGFDPILCHQYLLETYTSIVESFMIISHILSLDV